MTSGDTRAPITLRPKPAIFWLDRDVDATGTSGTGRVAEGVVFSNGWCALTWLTEFTSVAFYPNIMAVQAIHGHDGKTRITFKETNLPTLPLAAPRPELGTKNYSIDAVGREGGKASTEVQK